ncbi:MAG TPA: 4-hydroxythreonine-4-phosphate dehydrogenase PdxA, partial [Lysobacter sp.]
MDRLRLALVPGEPAGVGPELCVRLAHEPRDYSLTVFGDARTLHAAADAIGVPLSLRPPGTWTAAPGELALVDIPCPQPPAFGAPDPANARAVIDALLRAAAGCRAGEFGGLVTAPVHKAVINEGGIAYSGTTELLADDAGCDVVMMLANEIVRVALVTTHLPLRAVPDAITADAVMRCVRITARALQRDFGLASPRIAVLGLNPHAGEAGHLGREEIE